MWEKGQSHHGGATPGQVIVACIEKQDAKQVAFSPCPDFPHDELGPES